MTVRGEYKSRDEVADEIAKSAYESAERMIAKERQTRELFDRIKAEVEVRGTTTD